MKKFNQFVFCLLAFVIGAVGGFYGINYLTLPLTDSVNVSEETYYSDNSPSNSGTISTEDADISFHFLELGNAYTGDCILVQTADYDILIDCGSKSSSVSTVENYIKNYVTDGILEYVIVTHAHTDHYAGFATSANVDSVFDLFTVENVIQFSMTNQSASNTTYKNYLREIEETKERGTKVFDADECVSAGNLQVASGDVAQSVYTIGNGITMTILDSKYYTEKSTTENNYSVCTLFTAGEQNFLFTGDLEEDGEAELVARNSLPRVKLYKAGHHGSKTSSSDTLLSVIQPEIVCVCCCAGSEQYTKKSENQFPTQAFVDRVAPYTKNVYVTTLCVDYSARTFTSMNGNIVVMCKDANVEVKCSNNNTILKDTEWFKANRTTPESWR